MAKTIRSEFSHRKLDLVTEGLMRVLLRSKQCTFEQLFQRLSAHLYAANAVHGGPMMFRMRAYEKLQTLVKKGAVTKTNTHGTKLYSPVPREIKALSRENKKYSRPRTATAN